MGGHTTPVRRRRTTTASATTATKKKQSGTAAGGRRATTPTRTRTATKRRRKHEPATAAAPAPEAVTPADEAVFERVMQSMNAARKHRHRGGGDAEAGVAAAAPATIAPRHHHHQHHTAAAAHKNDHLVGYCDMGTGDTNNPYLLHPDVIHTARETARKLYAVEYNVEPQADGSVLFLGVPYGGDLPPGTGTQGLLSPVRNIGYVVAS